MKKIFIKKEYISPDYRPDIDGLRAIAVLSVVGFHAFPTVIKGGFVGVDIFFIISGYLISKILINQLESDRFDLREFYSRRARRIFPALLIVLTSCYAFGWIALFSDEYEHLGKHVAAGAAFVSNIILSDETGYFNGAADTKPLLHLWSLGIEEQFYLLWPYLLWIAHKKKINLLLVATAVLIISFTLNIKNIDANPISTFYLPQTRFWELSIGCVAAWISLHQIEYNEGWKKYINLRAIHAALLNNIFSALGMIFIITSLAITTKSQPYPGWWAVPPTLGAALLISAGSQTWISRNILSCKILIWFGLISFPLYLWHWPILSFLHITQSEAPSQKVRIIAVVISIFLAWLTYQIIEKPIRRKSNTRMTTITLMVFMTILGCIGYYTHINDGIKNRTANQKNTNAQREVVGFNWKFISNEICLNRYPYKNHDQYSWWFCLTNKDAAPEILILGDSFANHLYPGLAGNPKFNHRTILQIGTCDPQWVDEADFIGKAAVGGDKLPCAGHRRLEQQNFINDLIIKSNSINYTIISGLSPNPNTDDLIRLRMRISFLENNNSKVIVFYPHIHVPYDIKGCFPRPFKWSGKNCTISAMDYKKFMDKFHFLVANIKESNPKVLFFNQNELFCDKSNCTTIIEGVPLYRDEWFHYTEFASDKLAELFEKWASTNAPELIQ